MKKDRKKAHIVPRKSSPTRAYLGKHAIPFIVKNSYTEVDLYLELGTVIKITNFPEVTIASADREWIVVGHNPNGSIKLRHYDSAPT